MPRWEEPQPDESAHPVYDDGGTGLYAACTTRFADSGWDIRCDANHSVWVESPDSSYSVGIAQWMVERRPIENILDYIDAKMRNAEARSH